MKVEVFAMLAWIHTHWSKVSTGLLVATLLGVGGAKVYQHFASDCCYPGAPCCYPGSPCCAHHSEKVAER
jgi:hypothetical protein